MALLSGYSKNMAENAKYKIESTEGYQNAMLDLATKSHNVLGAILAEYQIRGVKDFSNTELNSAVNAVSTAWDRIEKSRAPARTKDPEENPLRRAIIQKVENQTINMPGTKAAPATPPIEATVVEPDLDF
jgi:hypothetical protein